MDEAVLSWRPLIQVITTCLYLGSHYISLNFQRDIYNNSKLLVELCIVKLDQDCFALMDLLAIILSPTTKCYVCVCVRT